MTWRIRLIKTAWGDQPPQRWAEGIIVQDRRESGYDLIRKANDIMGTIMLDGEVYEITPEPAGRRYCVSGNGSRTEQI